MVGLVILVGLLLVALVSMGIFAVGKVGEVKKCEETLQVYKRIVVEVVNKIRKRVSEINLRIQKYKKAEKSLRERCDALEKRIKELRGKVL